MNRRTGYSLLEVLIALAILMIGIIAVYRLFPMSMRAARLADEKIVASELASSRLGRLRSTGAMGPVLNSLNLYDGLGFPLLNDGGFPLADTHYAQLLAAAGDVYALYEGYTTTLQRLRGASEIYYQRALFSVQMPDGRDETFVTYIVEQ